MKMSFRFKKLTAFSILLLSYVQLSATLIVPQELPSVLSLVYSNIPPIKKGTDSRLGFGFRLGEHADFQVLLELGPQKETRPIGDPADSENSFNKRHVSKPDQQFLLRQQQLVDLSSTERTASSWLQSWSKDISASKKRTKQKPKSQHGAHSQTQKQSTKLPQQQMVHPLPTAATLPEQSLKQLQLLYKMATTTTEASSILSTESSTTATNSKTNATTTTTTHQTPTIKPFRGGPLNLGGPSGFKPLPSTTKAEMPSQLLTIVQPRKTKSQITAELMDVSLEDAT